MAAITSVMRVQQLFLAEVERQLAPFDLTFARYELLQLLAFSRAGSLPLGKVGARLQVHPTSVTNAVDRLQAQGYVTRERHETDRRTTLAAITPAGREVVEEATAVLNKTAFAHVGLTEPEVEQLLDLLTAVRQSFENTRTS
jgi:DNA-binding MarR family transcriptional regulator